MDLRSLTTRAKELIERRGGSGTLKQDADELKGIAQGEGSLTDKAKAAAEALKEPGADEGPAAAPAEASAADAGPAKRERGAGKDRGRGKARGGGQRGGGRGRKRL